jgi:rhodanese-related sulfurtransferase
MSSGTAITATELAQRIQLGKAPHLLDVRQPEEFAMVALPGAKLIPLMEVPQRVGELGAWRGEEVVVYCHHGVRSQHAIGFLRQHGFIHLRNLTGGIDAWSLEVDENAPRY